MVEPCENMGERLRDLRLARRLTQVELAEKSGVSQAYISSYELGRHDNIRVKTIARLARALGVTVDHLVWGGLRNDQDTP